jgi:hypothetical protein
MLRQRSVLAHGASLQLDIIAVAVLRHGSGNVTMFRRITTRIQRYSSICADVRSLRCYCSDAMHRVVTDCAAAALRMR